MATLASLTFVEWVILICFVGLSLTLPVIALGRLRFAKTAADLARAWPNENVRPNPVIRMILRYLTLGGLQLLLDLSFVWLLGYWLFLHITTTDASAFLEAMPPLWPWALVAVARIGLDQVIRSIHRRVREQLLAQ